MREQQKSGWFYLLPIIGVFFTWMYYSNPESDQVVEGTNQIQLIPLSALWEDERLHSQPVLLQGEANISVSSKIAGVFILDDGYQRLLILARGFTPKSDEEVIVLCIPRQVFVINNQTFLVAAFVDFRYVQRIEDSEEKRIDKSI